MHHPRRNHFLKFKRIDAKRVYMDDFLTEESWEISVETARFLKALNGKTNPYRINTKLSKDCVDQLLYLDYLNSKRGEEYE